MYMYCIYKFEIPHKCPNTENCLLYYTRLGFLTTLLFRTKKPDCTNATFQSAKPKNEIANQCPWQTFVIDSGFTIIHI